MSWMHRPKDGGSAAGARREFSNARSSRLLNIGEARLRYPLILAIVIGLLLGLFAAPGEARAELNPQRVNDSIDLAIKYLKREQKSDGSWPGWLSHDGTALCTLALLTAGVSPQDPVVQKGLNRIRRSKARTTYVVSLDTMALCLGDPKQDLVQIRDNAAWLANQQITSPQGRGMWGYPSGPGDNSNTQFALLALYEAERTLERFGIESPVPTRTWQMALDYWQSSQNEDGSWGYTRDGAGTGSMTCAGISSVVICLGRLRTGAVQVNGENVQCCSSASERNHVQRALDWLGRRDVFSVHANPRESGGMWWLYYLYGLERAGRLTATRLIGDHDWYREGVEVLLDNQDRLAGFWKGIGHVEQVPHVATSFALLFMAKGRRPVGIAKLKYGPPDSGWNIHPGDVGNMTQYVETRWRRDLAWHVVDSGAATADDYMQAPILFFTGMKSLPLADDPVKVKELRTYIDRGGVILADACCDDPSAFDRSFQALMDKVFPEPEFRLRPLGPEHEIWFIEETPGPEYAGKMYGVSVGCRTGVFYCRDLDEPLTRRARGLSCFWELGRQERTQVLAPKVQQRVDSAFSLGINILAYATNRELKFKYEIPAHKTEETPVTAIERALLVIPKLRHGGGWNTAPGALPSLQRSLVRETGLLTPTDQRELNITDAALYNHHLVFLHGRNAFAFTSEERAALKRFVEQGGMIFGDAVCASEAFANSFRQEMEQIFQRKLEPIAPEHPMFTQEYGGFDVARVKRREPPRDRGAGPARSIEQEAPPDFSGLMVEEGIYSVIFSKYDLSCALENHEALQCRGYVRDDAARLAINVVLYSLHQK